MVYWDRPKGGLSNAERIKYFADKNCLKISHLLAHELMRMLGRPRKLYFDEVHKLYQKHVDGKFPVMHFSERFDPVLKGESYHFATIDIKKISEI